MQTSLYQCGFSHGLLGVEWKVVRRFIDQDACHGQDQAEPGRYPTQRPRQREGRLAVHARGKGNLTDRYLSAGDDETDVDDKLTG